MAGKISQATAHPSSPLRGNIRAPGDKSISHRALIFAGIAAGNSRISGLLEGDDVLRTAAAMRALGAEIERDGTEFVVTGGPLRDPDHALYLGNSGTGVRLLMGVAAGAGVTAQFDGDASLRGRPMGRILEPLRAFGISTDDRNGCLPVTISGATRGALNTTLAKPSAQVKSAILLAALGATGTTRLHEPILCRDHTERMLEAFGVTLAFEDDGSGGRYISIDGGQSLTPTDITVPGDPSSAAFPVAAAVMIPGSDICVRNVMINPTRIGFFETLKEMGADLTFENQRFAGGEPVADIRARHSVLHSVETPPERAASMIDEYPILAIIAAFANGDTMMRGLEELRIKESDRIASVEAGLNACGISTSSGDDWLCVSGGPAPQSTASIRTHHDHRIAMSFLILGLAATSPISIDDQSMIATSFPGFFDVMTALGANIDC